jgi:hypothetical protein
MWLKQIYTYITSRRQNRRMLKWCLNKNGKQYIYTLPSYKKSRYGTYAGQVLLSLTKFIKILAILVYTNKFIIKIYLTIYLIILIIYHKY